MSSDTRMRPLGDFIKLVSGSTPSKADASYWNGLTPWISAKDMGSFWIEDSEDHLTEEGVNAASKLVPPGTVLLLTRGMTLHKRVPICRTAKAATFNQDVKAVLPREGLSSDFLPYLLVGNHDRLHERVDAAGHGTGRLNTDALVSFPVWVPSLAEQDAIAAVGEALDDRLRLLRETNATLEAIAQALFKSWFVDFDPVRAKMAGRAPEGIDEATASLFPDALEETELGVVPKGWQFGTVGHIARLKKGTVNPGSQPDAMFEHFSLPAFDSGCRPAVEPGEAIKSNKTPVPSDAVLLSKLNPHIPRVWLPVSCGSNAVCSTEFLVFQPVGSGSKELIYCVFSSPDFILRLQQLVTGTSNSHQRIKPDQVELMSCVVPTQDIASQFELSMKPIFERVHANREQVQTLASLRDALLPRLISGQLRLPEVQDDIRRVIT